MIPALDKFSRDTNFNGAIYHTGLDSAWRSLAGDANVPGYGEMAEEFLASCTSDTEE